MNPDVKARWVAALRSGEYKQGEGRLVNTEDNEYCCLGVLCDLAVKAGVAESKQVKDSDGNLLPALIYGTPGTNPNAVNDGGHDEDTSNVWSSGFLPPIVAEWAGIAVSSPAVMAIVNASGGEKETPLSALNDSFEFTFGQIADLIEGQL